MESIKNLLQWINDNWATIITIATLIFAIYKKIEKVITDWKAKSEEEKQKILDEQIAKAQNALKEYILILVAQAEIDWQNGEKLGAIKRAQVIQQIYEKYPVLEQVADQEELMTYIDSLINEALKIVREKIRNN